MKREHIIVTFIALFSIVFTGGVLVGGITTRSQIYHKCLETNSSMIYSALAKVCREQVK